MPGNLFSPITFSLPGLPFPDSFSPEKTRSYILQKIEETQILEKTKNRKDMEDIHKYHKNAPRTTFSPADMSPFTQKC